MTITVDEIKEMIKESRKESFNLLDAYSPTSGAYNGHFGAVVSLDLLLSQIEDKENAD